MEQQAIKHVIGQTIYSAEQKLVFWWITEAEKWYIENDEDYIDGFTLSFDELEDEIGIVIERLQCVFEELVNLNLLKYSMLYKRGYKEGAKLSTYDFVKQYHIQTSTPKKP